MEDMTVIVAPSLEQTRILGTFNEHEIFKAALPGLSSSDEHALPTLLEGIARWTRQRLCVVLVADESAPTSCAATYEALVDNPTLFYEVGVAVRERRRRARQTIGGVASFRDLHAFRARTYR